MKYRSSTSLNLSIVTTPRNLFWAVPCLLLALVFTGCGANNSTPAAAATATPAFSPAPGTYPSAQTVTLSSATPGSAIYYTTDGTAPTASSARYSGAIPVGASVVVEAMAVASGYTDSSLTTGGYVITPSPVSGPAIPASAIASSDIQTLDGWHFNHDTGTPGTAEKQV